MGKLSLMIVIALMAVCMANAVLDDAQCSPTGDINEAKPTTYAACWARMGKAQASTNEAISGKAQQCLMACTMYPGVMATMGAEGGAA